MKKVWLAVCAVLAAVPAHAQGEAALKEYFEGKSIVVKLDMPATAEGVDVFPDARRPMDFNQYAARIKSTGIALKSGESAMITKVRVKDKLIEFQLGGGGFGTFSDDTSTSVYVPSTPKSSREKTLEREVKAESDSARKRRLQRELDDLREDREREDERKKVLTRAAEEQKKDRIAQQRLHGGSRFNIRYQDGVPPGLEPAGIMRALAEYVEFPWASDRSAIAPSVASPELRRQMAGSGALYKGMTVAEVEQALGRPEKTSERSEGSLKVTTASYSHGDQTITADFVEGVLIKYSISSK